LTAGLLDTRILGSVRVKVAEFVPFFHCNFSTSGYECIPGGAVMFFPDVIALTGEQSFTIVLPKVYANRIGNGNES
jgi:hypothetical protein